MGLLHLPATNVAQNNPGATRGLLGFIRIAKISAGSYLWIMQPNETVALLAAANEVRRLVGLDFARPSENADRTVVSEIDPSEVRLAQQYLWLREGLSALFGADFASAQSWLRTENLDLGARPVDLLQSSKGLETVCNYLSAFQHRS